jgi:hypothetical protein
MPSSNQAHAPAAPAASRSITSFLHLSAGNMQAGSGSSHAALRPSASVNRLTDEFLRSVSGVGVAHRADADTGNSGGLDEDVVAKMLSDGARTHDAHLHKISLSATNSHSFSRSRMGRIPSVSGSSGSPRSTDRRSRAGAAVAAGSASPSPTSLAAASSAQSQRFPQHQKASRLVQQPKEPLQQAQRRHAPGAAASSAHVSPLPAASLGDPAPLNNSIDMDISGAAQSVPDNALVVLAGLEDIREKKARALESSLGRESVCRFTAVHDIIAAAACCGCLMPRWQVLITHLADIEAKLASIPVPQPSTPCILPFLTPSPLSPSAQLLLINQHPPSRCLLPSMPPLLKQNRKRLIIFH